MTRAEADHFLRIPQLCRWAALPVVAVSVPAVFFVWQDAGHACGNVTRLSRER